jgi:MFS superfamily sulfate permease-like transporter
MRSELVIYLSTFGSILFFGLATGVLVAVLLSVTAFLLRISQLELREETGPAGYMLRIKGALFYASLEPLSEAFHRHLEEDLTVDLQYTTHIDQSAVDFFSREARHMAGRGHRLKLLINDRQRHFLQAMGVSSQVTLQSLQENARPESGSIAINHSATMTGEKK